MDKELEKKVEQLQEMIDGSDNIVFFGGAGVSTESGRISPYGIFRRCRSFHRKRNSGLSKRRRTVSSEV